MRMVPKTLTVHIVLSSSFMWLASLNPCAALRLERPPIPWYVEANGASPPSPFTQILKGDKLAKQVQKFGGAGGNHYALVFFYSPYCPHCQKFLPHLERVAYGIEEAGRSILVGRVDCTLYLEVCRAYMPGRTNLPGLVFGAVQKWSKPKSLAIADLPDDTAEDLQAWLSQKVGTHFPLPSLTDFQRVWRKALSKAEKNSPESSIAKPEPGKADVWDIQLATAMFLRSALDQLQQTSGKSKKNGTRAFKDFVLLLADRYPSHACRAAFTDLHKLFKARTSLKPKDFEKSWKMCGHVPWDKFRNGWSSCRGSLPGKRGFTCGLWSLLHMLSARSGSRFSPLEGFQITRSALWNFFDCEDCKHHFFNMPATNSDASSREKAQLWWWEAHNKVNARVRREEAQSGDGDPAFVKSQWPSPHLCGSCRSSSGGGFLLKSRIGGTYYKVANESEAVDMPEPDVAPHDDLQAAHTGEQSESAAEASWNRNAVVKFLRHYYYAT
eukprot:CAMPEP_0178427160 /NCGR_PEP_ID=MMETSP0689_2-20121128/29600_1 /TAXON_ID=160604 /ORGANISM="Amphidinium massartii, Strain CS-259" /LENGTH=495 /DNA_ID=CAMNT_0020048855 /DNA_START=37 /DNA_END=1524 /DNA_ORIENTATION=+